MSSEFPTRFSFLTKIFISVTISPKVPISHLKLSVIWGLPWEISNKNQESVNHIIVFSTSIYQLNTLKMCPTWNQNFYYQLYNLVANLLNSICLTDCKSEIDNSWATGPIPAVSYSMTPTQNFRIKVFRPIRKVMIFFIWEP